MQLLKCLGNSMDNENDNKNGSENKEDIDNENIKNPLCINGVCKIPENNFEKESITNKDMMLNMKLKL